MVEPSPSMSEPLESEMKAYEAELPKLLSDAGKFAVYFGDKNLGIFTTYNEALIKGYEVAKDKPFLVQQISAIHQTQQFTRIIEFEDMAS